MKNIDSVDVSGCRFLDDYSHSMCNGFRGDNSGFHQGYCLQNPNCYYKQLAHKTEELRQIKRELELEQTLNEAKQLQECEYCLQIQKLQEQNKFLIKEFTRTDQQRDYWREQAEKYQKALEKIKEITAQYTVVSCAGVYDCTNCEDEITEQGETCMERGMNKIIKICEVLNDK